MRAGISHQIMRNKTEQFICTVVFKERLFQFPFSLFISAQNLRLLGIKNLTLPSSRATMPPSEQAKTLSADDTAAGGKRFLDHINSHRRARNTRRTCGQRVLKSKQNGAKATKKGCFRHKKDYHCGSHPRGREFESLQVHQKPAKSCDFAGFS